MPIDLSRILINRDLSRTACVLASTVVLALLAACSSASSPTSTAVPTATDSPRPIPTATSKAGGPTTIPVTPIVSSPSETAIGVIPIPPDRDLYELARRITLQTTDPVHRFASPVPPPLNRGDRLEWNVNRQNGNVRVMAEVRHVSENAYWVFEDSFEIDQGRIVQAAELFEQTIWPSVINTLGDVWNPGVDGDPRIVIFHGQLRPGVAGYFAGVDQYPVAIQPESNQREAIHISSTTLTLGGNGYLSTLAHELQHAVHWAADAGEESWLNEGIAEIASGLAGFQPGSINSFLSKPNTSLVQWEPEIFQASPNYGAAALFFDYIAGHYGGTETLRAIVNHPADGMESIDSILIGLGFNVTAKDVFEDWVVANLVDDDGGLYAHLNRETNRPRITFVPLPDGLETETIDDSVRPFGTNYYTLEGTEQPAVILFNGQPNGQVFPAAPHSGDTCWWSNAGDSINTKLTRPVDLTGVDSATFEFWTWHAIEEDWDYAYITVSTDDGVTWQVLGSDRASRTNPNGTAFGPGLTGLTNGWVRDQVDLSAYAGQEILLRLEYITDDAIHDRGACFDDFSIPEIGWSDSTDAVNGWTSEGFALINDQKPLEYLVQVIRDTQDDSAVVERIDIDAEGEGFFSLQNVRAGEEVTIAVSVLNPNVTGSLEYSIELARPRL